MRKITIYSLLFAFLLASCGNVKEIQQLVYSGNYDSAINLSLEKLRKKKGKKSADPYAALLKEAYDKANARDLKKIENLKRDVNPEKWQNIYDTYLQIDTRQENVKPILPLHLVKQNKQLNFEFHDYTSQIIDAKNHLTVHLYKKAGILLRSANKADVRKAYDLLDELDRINPNYKDVRNLMNQAHQKGMTYALVEIKNNSNKIIPRRLSDELLNFSSYGASNFWVDYHNKPVKNLQYDYKINLNFTQIQISSDQEREKEIVEEKDIQDGYVDKRDANGNIMKDKDGKTIRVPRMIRVRSQVHLYQQYKEALVNANAEIIDLRSNVRKGNIPLDSKFIFDYRYATYRGDKRAIRDEYIDFLNKRRVQFPTNEQMVYDASQEIKMKFKDILNKADFL